MKGSSVNERVSTQGRERAALVSCIRHPRQKSSARAAPPRLRSLISRGMAPPLFPVLSFHALLGCPRNCCCETAVSAGKQTDVLHKGLPHGTYQGTAPAHCRPRRSRAGASIRGAATKAPAGVQVRAPGATRSHPRARCARQARELINNRATCNVIAHHVTPCSQGRAVAAHARRPSAAAMLVQAPRAARAVGRGRARWAPPPSRVLRLPSSYERFARIALRLQVASPGRGSLCDPGPRHRARQRGPRRRTSRALE